MELVTVVVVPARDEQDRIGACLEALAAQTVGRHTFETILVADACRDRTEQVARETAARLGLTLTVLPGPGEGSGPARKLGMDAAAERLRSRGRPRGLIATTDADTTPAPDWLERQLAHLERGADVIAGAIELATDAGELPDAVLERRRRDAETRMATVAAVDPGAAHHHFAGASLGVNAEVYRQVGGMDATSALEDEAFAGALAVHKIPILRAADVRVRTAVRTEGRAARGLSVDLAVSTWLARRRYTAAEFGLDGLRDREDRPSVTVVIPARECATTVAGVIETTVGPAYDAGLVDQVVVVDAASIDGTADRAAAAGATVMQQDELAPELGPALGKGDAMWRALAATGGEIVCFLDADTEDPDPGHLLGLLGPLLTDPEIALVKGAFARPFNAGGRALPDEGGRVTELMARPLLNLHVPLLAGFTQPLAGEFAGRRRLLERLPFPVGYGIEIALLIDALEEMGLEALAECRLGSRQNRHQSLRALGEMAFAVLAAVERRTDGPRSATGGQFLRPWEDGRIVRVPVGERPPLGSPERSGRGAPLAVERRAR
jgi:glucosyl-3-phosphoglycerate synthase